MRKYVYFLEKSIDDHTDIFCYRPKKCDYKVVTSTDEDTLIDGKWEREAKTPFFVSIEDIDRYYDITERGGKFLGEFDTLNNPVEVLYA